MLGVTAALSVVDGVAGAGPEGFRVGYVAEDGMQCRVGLADAWAVRFEAMGPARRFTARKGQLHLSGFPAGRGGVADCCSR
jgi:hypothetical protein